MKQEEILRHLKKGGMLLKCSSFIGHKNIISYQLVDANETHIKIHHKTGQSLEKKNFLRTIPKSYRRTLAGSTKELWLNSWKCDKI